MGGFPVNARLHFKATTDSAFPPDPGLVLLFTPLMQMFMIMSNAGCAVSPGLLVVHNKVGTCQID